MRSIFININRFLSAVVVILTTGCQQYDVTINDTLVYQPKRLFRDYTISDPGLAACVAQAITDFAQSEYFDNFAMVVYSHPVSVARTNKF